MEEEKIWNYYKTIADKIGRDKDGKEKGFSVSWFYDKDYRQYFEHGLNKLTKAFLGDMSSLEAVIAADEPELASMRSRVRNICGNEPYPAQVDAIARAILNDITIIQGPPGTGKTETIKNILLCLRTVRPESKIAVISSNNEAISNAEEAIRTENSLCSSYARLGRKKLREEFKKKLETDNSMLYEQLESCGKDNDWQYPQIFLDTYPIIFSTIHSLRKCVDIDEYDYVIVDECSQVPSMIGMIAIASAKHLVLLGDNEQLPPIHKEDENESIIDAQEIRQAAAWYLDEKDNSFMKACEAVFGDRCGNVLLNEHYRCHPAIIEFCNREIYGDRLVTRTADDGKLPIRIRWYEGDYWEKIDASETERTKNYNRKQIQVFIRDEYPEIKEILRNNHDYGICVLSPYRCQLEELKRRLDDMPVEAAVPIENEIEQSEEGVNDVAQLTIHKAQGRGFERVYIMPVEDTGSHPWSQRKELINVAVSRAKKELCVITSAHWMSEEMQKSFLGYAVTSGRESEHDRYIQKLLKYVEEEQQIRDADSEYGFQKASMESVFDKTLYYRSRYDYERKESLSAAGISAPEYCMLHALNACPEIRNRYEIYREVMLREIEGISGESDDVKEYIENDARFDIVIAKKNGKGEGSDIQAVIEIDGAYHRSDPDMTRKDELKDQAVASLGADFAAERYFRFPTDGTTENEVEKILSALLQSDLKCGKLSADCDEKMWRDRRMIKIVPKIAKYDRGFKIMIEDWEIDEGVPSIREQLNDLLNEGMRFSERQQYFKEVVVSDEWLSQHLLLNEERPVTLSLGADDLEKEECGNFFELENEISPEKLEYIVFGAEEGEKHITASPYHYLKELTEHIGEALEEGKLFELIDADESLDYSTDRTTQDVVKSNYRNQLQNDYYVLRHAPVYYFVYYRMFRSLLEELPNDPIRLHILSIGCGIKTEALALRQALRHCENNVTATKYIGVDVGSWNESDYFLYLNNVNDNDDDDEYIRLSDEPGAGTYIEQEQDIISDPEDRKLKLNDFQARAKAAGEQAVYLIVFPNSVSEIKPEELESLLEHHIMPTYRGKHLYICLSRNTSNSPIDKDQADIIRDKLGEDKLIVEVSPDTERENIGDEGFGRSMRELNTWTGENGLFNEKIWNHLKISEEILSFLENLEIVERNGDELENDDEMRMTKRIIQEAFAPGLKDKLNKIRDIKTRNRLLKKPISIANLQHAYNAYEIYEYEVPEQ